MGYNLVNSKEWTGDVGASRPMAYQERSPDVRYKSIPTLTTEQQDRFWAKVEVHQPAGCWEWTGTVLGDGYGQFSIWRVGAFMSHRLAYSLLVSNVPTDMQIDHLCRNRSCCNPDHLQPVSGITNMRRGYSPFGINAKKTHCKNGHEFTPENTFYFPSQNGKRTCRACWMAKSATESGKEAQRRAGRTYYQSDRGKERREAYRESERGKASARASAAKYRAKKRAERDGVVQ